MLPKLSTTGWVDVNNNNKILFYSSGGWKIQDQDSVSGAISLSGSLMVFFIYISAFTWWEGKKELGLLL